MNADLSAFLDRYATPIPETGCWIWLGCVNDKGYGMVGVGRLAKRAHRVSYALAHGTIEPGKNVCHRCDVRACVNPNHLFLGTQAQNIADMVSKKRQRFGTRKNRARGEQLSKLTTAQVLAIREDARSAILVAKTYGIAESYVYKIRSKSRWSHI